MTAPQPQISAVGVYRWPYTDEDVSALGKWLYSNPTPANMQAAKEQLDSLVVVELSLQSEPLDSALDGLSQTASVQRNGNEQCPYDETWWDESGSVCIGRAYKAPSAGPCRAVFFLHFFEPEAPLYTASDEKIPLPALSVLPARLAAALKYEFP